MAVSRTIAAAALGAGAAYFLDPDNGTRRRHMARDRGLAFFRRPAKRAVAGAERQARYAAGVAKGVAHQAASAGGERDAERLNDAGLAAKVKSEAFRAEDAPKDSIDINVEAGVIYLRGEADSPGQIEELIEKVEAVDGVRAVESLLHVPGEPAPMKS